MEENIGTNIPYQILELINSEHSYSNEINEINKGINETRKSMIDNNAENNQKLKELILKLKTVNEEHDLVQNKIIETSEIIFKENINQNKLFEYIFPEILSSKIRKSLHNIGDSLSLNHSTIGSGRSRMLVISNKNEDDKLKEINENWIEEEKVNVIVEKNKNETEQSELILTPYSISEFKIKKMDSSFIYVEIEPPESFNSSITHYNVYKEKENKELEFLKSNESKEIKIPIDSERIQIFYLKACNSNGEGSISMPIKLKSLKYKQFTLYGCGFNNGRIYFETNEKVNEFQMFSDFKKVINQVSINSNVLALVNSGGVVSWGASFDGEEIIPSDPYLVFDIENPIQSIIVRNVAAGEDFSICSTIDGKVFSWGINSYGQLGQGDKLNRDSPCQISILKSQFVSEVYANGFHASVLNDNHIGYTWGRALGVAGLEVKDKFGNVVNFQNYDSMHCLTPRKIEIDGIQIMALGYDHTLLLTIDNNLFSFGKNDFWQLGISKEHFPDILQIVFPMKIDFLNDTKIKIISTGGKNSLVIAEINDNEFVFSWGCNSEFQIAPIEKAKVDFMYKWKPFTDKAIKEVSQGINHTIFLTANNEVFGFGNNKYFCLPNKEGIYPVIKEVTKIDVENINGEIEKVVAGKNFTGLLVND